MGFKTLITRNGTAPYNADEFRFEVTNGGALRIIGNNETVDLIGPGYWVAVVDGTGHNRLDWDFLAQPPMPQAPTEPVRVTIEDDSRS